MIDMHSHILPGIDDGAKTPGDALVLLRAAIKDGVRIQVLTPHIHQGKYDNNLSVIRKEFEKFRNAIQRVGLPVELDFAAEVRLDDSVKELVKNEEIPFLGSWKGRNVMLLEFPANNIPVGALNIVRWLFDHGIIAMIAHPERNLELQQKPEKIRPFLELGCMLQVTAGSLTGQFGRAAFETAVIYLRYNIVTLLATDCHNMKYRPPILRKGATIVSKLVGTDIANKLVNINPMKLREGLYSNTGKMASGF